jgi:hypothetical protein
MDRMGVLLCADCGVAHRVQQAEAEEVSRAVASSSTPASTSRLFELGLIDARHSFS